MTFDSLTFVVFLALVFAVYWSIRSWTAKKALLLGASYLFYAAWNPFFVLLLVATTCFDWFAARWMDRVADPARRKLILAASITINLSALGFFKYAQFLADTAIELLRLVGVDFKPVSLGILLPIGISFYTFESLSYVIDVYRRRVPVSTSLLDYSMFVTFFPHLVAGPILRYGDFSPQCQVERRWTDAPVGRGMALLAYGLALKVLLADLVFAPVSDQVFANATQLGFADSWLGACAFSFQVYCDFAGYSLCAIGAALMFGFRFPMNFENPFASVGISELWTRWHISLATWIRDYVFVPLGGYRKGAARGYLNLFVAFLLVGLWHGAAWTYVAWGGIHGVFLVSERLVRQHVWDFGLVKNLAGRVALALVTFALFTIAVVFFRATSFAQAWAIIESMAGIVPAGAATFLAPGQRLIAEIFGLAILAAHIRYANLRGWDWLDQRSVGWRAVTVGACLAAVVFSPGLNPAFLYFQF
jgi:D-alanyl-lipoteichoic acid acyltransferase DltB (MBOAT superfamily)